MKKTILSLALLLVVGGTAPICAQRHRHTPRSTTTAVASQPSAATTTATAAQADDDELVAYSDTTTTDTTTSAASSADNDDAADNANDPFLSWAIDFGTTFGTFTSIMILIVLFLFLIAPFIVLLAILRYIVRRHNDRVRLAEKAMESGYSLNDEQIPLSRKSPEYIWRRGVRNVSIGAGIMLFLWFLHATPLVGIGGLVACIGLGQMFMARFNYDSKFCGKKKHDADKQDIFEDLNDDITDLQFGDETKEKEKK